MPTFASAHAEPTAKAQLYDVKRLLVNVQSVPSKVSDNSHQPKITKERSALLLVVRVPPKVLESQVGMGYKAVPTVPPTSLGHSYQWMIVLHGASPAVG